MEKFREHVNCRLCGADDYKVMYTWPKNYYDHSKYETASWDGRQEISLRICKCNKCGLAYSNPSFKEKYLDLVYPEDIVPSLDNITSEGVFFDLLNFNKYKDIYEIVKQYIQSRNNATVLDIGTRYGGLPHYFREQNYNSYGLELNERSVELANKFGLDYIYQGTISDLRNYLGGLLPNNLDCVIMDDVLEHLVNPFEDIQTIASCQDEGDMLVMRQMNWDGIGHKIFGKNWYYLQPAAHMSYFTPKTGKKLLEKAGYSRVKIFKKNVVSNIIRTFARFGKKLVLGENRWKVNSGKIMYLQERNKMYDDMFTIIGVK